MAELKHILKELEFRQNFIGEGFLKPPEGNFSRVNLFGEVTSLSGFTEENLYIFSEFSLPVGWKVDDENEYYLIYKAENVEEENINKLKSVSQVSEAFVEMYQTDESKNIGTGASSNFIGPMLEEQNEYKHNFCTPFELELLCHDYIVDRSNPKLLLQVNSVDSYNRHRIEGYCFLNIPMDTGFYQIEIPCYKPKEDNYMKVFSFFLGGSRKIPDLREIAKTSSKNEKNVDSVLNRYGISTEYTGKVRVNLNVVIQSKDYLEKSRAKVKNKQGREAYQLLNKIESQFFPDQEDEVNVVDKSLNLMMTKQHGIINRFSNTG